MPDFTPAAAHLDAERLAALADEAPTAAEAAHLAACAACRREREAYVALVALARAEGAGDSAVGVYADASADAGVGAGAVGPNAAGAWDALAAALRTEGLAGGRGAGALPARVDEMPRWTVVRGAARGPAAWGRRESLRLPSRLAAGLLLVAGAAAAGRLSATRGPLAVAPNDTVRGAADAGTFASTEDARAALARARRDYAQAAAFLAAADPLGAGDDAALAAADRAGADAELLRARLATIDALLPRVRAAALQAPEDPAVNQLYLSAYDARETALRQLGRTLPAGAQLTGY